MNLSAYRRVLRVFSKADNDGDMFAIITVRELPTKESRSMCVNLLCL